MARLGVGLTYVKGTERLLDGCADLLDVVELEPQTIWRSHADGSISCDQDSLRRLADLPGARLLHGVGNPVGGCRLPDLQQLELFGELAEQLQVPWVSEHLAFNRVGDGEDFGTGFMLPPRQTAAGVGRSARSIRAMADALPVPLAVEIGVNYLRPRADELPDGEFVARVSEEAGCGLLLDLHNILANERNGRGRVTDLLAELPLERVWEVHLAGGFEHRGYWLDAHSGLPDEELLRLAEQVLPQLPALRAVLFEVTASATPQLDVQAVRELLTRVRELWSHRPASPFRARLPQPPDSADGVSPEEWEYTLGSLAIGRSLDTPLARELAADPALPLLRELITEFRGSAVAGTLRYTLRLLLLTLGETGVRELLDDYTRACPPRLFATHEAADFAAYLRRTRPAVPWLTDVLELDLGLTRVQVDSHPCTVTLGADPAVLLAELGAGRLPIAPPRGTYRVQLVDDHGRTSCT